MENSRSAGELDTSSASTLQVDSLRTHGRFRGAVCALSLWCWRGECRSTCLSAHLPRNPTKHDRTSGSGFERRRFVLWIAGGCANTTRSGACRLAPQFLFGRERAARIDAASTRRRDARPDHSPYLECSRLARLIELRGPHRGLSPMTTRFGDSRAQRSPTRIG